MLARVINYISYKLGRFKHNSKRVRVNLVHPFVKGEDGFYKRSYGSKDDYLGHQSSKEITDHHMRAERMEGRWHIWRDEFVHVPELKPGTSILCLGAREGSEVEALREMGLFAVGLDLNYPPKCRFTHYGDFHNIPYPDACTDAVYINTLNHATDLKRVIGEIKRVLKPNTGTLVLHIRDGVDEGAKLDGLHHSVAWSHQEQVIDMFKQTGFEIKASGRWQHRPVFSRYVMQRAA